LRKCLPPSFGQRWQLLLVPPTATFALSLLVKDAEDVQPEVLEKLRICETELESMIEAVTEKLESVRECIRMLESDLADAEQARAARTGARTAIGRRRASPVCAA
jgi:hypothetical protein